MPERSDGLLALVETAQLDAVGFTEITARFDPAPEADLAGIDVHPSYTLHVDNNQHGFQITLRVDVGTGAGAIAVEAYAQYKTQDGAPDLSTALLVEYANEVGIMALLPYVRQAIADVTQRVFGNPLLMPVIARGDLTFDAPDPEQVSGN